MSPIPSSGVFSISIGSGSIGWSSLLWPYSGIGGGGGGGGGVEKVQGEVLTFIIRVTKDAVMLCPTWQCLPPVCG